MTRVFGPLRGVAAGLLFSAAGSCLAQEGTLRLIQETYFTASSGSRGLQHSADWTEVHAALSNHLSAVLSDFKYGRDGMLDEDYLEFDQDRSSVRAGRLRSAFGFGSWSDLWYNPVISMPICRLMPLADGINLSNFNSGVEAKAWNGSIQGELAVLNVNPSEETVLPGNLSFERARVQVADGTLLLGVNAIAQNGNLSRSSPHALGLDYRWTASHVLVRGEAMQGYGSGSVGRGYYTDVTVRPPKFFRTQLGGRVDNFDGHGIRANLYTAAVRQILTPNLSLSLNYSWGSVPDFLYPMTGWHLETSFGVRIQ